MMSRGTWPSMADDLVAHRHAGARGRRSGRDSDDSGSRHRTRLRRLRAAAEPRRCSPGAAMAVDKVLLAAPRGFCAGVEMAIKALAWMVRAFEPPVYCYHEIVHNQLVVDRFRDLGVVFVDDIAEVPPGRPIMLSAHGSAPEVVAAARASGGYVVDAVCPLVTKVHHEVKVRAGKGYQIVYVGHEGHEEAVGTMAVAPEAIHRVESRRRGRRPPRLRRSRWPCSPRPRCRHRDWAARGRRAPRSASPTCGRPAAATCASPPPTASRALGEIAERCDAVVVIGSANSSNTRALEQPGPRVRCAAGVPVNGRRRAARRPHRHRRASPPAPRRPRSSSRRSSPRLAPVARRRGGRITEEDEYFPPPRDLRDLLTAVDVLATFSLGGSVPDRPALRDRDLAASDVLAQLT